MTTGEYVMLRETLLAGCIAERVNLVAGMSPRRLREFITRLDLIYCEPLLVETWRILARTAAERIKDLEEKIERLENPGNPCPDPLNSECCCEHCEAVSYIDDRRDG